MKFGWRLAGIALMPIVGLLVIVVSRLYMYHLSAEAVELVSSTHRWLAMIIVLYLINFVVAWRYANSWRISMSRMLIFGVIAYLCISYVIDIIGNNDSLFRQIVGFSPPVDLGLVVSIRMRILSWFVGCCLSLVCIGLGFEMGGRSEESG